VEITRGAIVVMAARGAYTNKPRPAVVLQANAFNPTHLSITVCPITSGYEDASLFRVALPPGGRTGLSSASQVMVDKVVSIPRTAIGRQIGSCDPIYVDAIDQALRVWLAL
jgi:mRNA interferase MazF